MNFYAFEFGDEAVLDSRVCNHTVISDFGSKTSSLTAITCYQCICVK